MGVGSAVINAPLDSIARDLGFVGDNSLKGLVVRGPPPPSHLPARRQSLNS